MFSVDRSTNLIVLGYVVVHPSLKKCLVRVGEGRVVRDDCIQISLDLVPADGEVIAFATKRSG